MPRNGSLKRESLPQQKSAMSDIEYRTMNKATQRSFTQHWLLSTRKSTHSPEVKNNLSFARRNERTRRDIDSNGEIGFSDFILFIPAFNGEICLSIDSLHLKEQARIEQQFVDEKPQRLSQVRLQFLTSLRPVNVDLERNLNISTV